MHGIPAHRAISPHTYRPRLQKRLKDEPGRIRQQPASWGYWYRQMYWTLVPTHTENCSSGVPHAVHVPTEPNIRAHPWQERSASVCEECCCHMVTGPQPQQISALSKAPHASVFRWGPKPRFRCSGQNGLASHTYSKLQN